MNRIFLFCIVVFLFAGGFLLYKKKTDSFNWNEIPKKTLPIFSEKFDVKRIQVIQGHEFDLILRNNRRIHAFLFKTSTLEAKDDVVELINNSKTPRVALIRENQNGWTVDLFLTIDGKEVSLVAWLQDHDLIQGHI